MNIILWWLIRAVCISCLYKTDYFHIVFIQLLDEEAAHGMVLFCLKSMEGRGARYVKDVYTYKVIYRYIVSVLDSVLQSIFILEACWKCSVCYILIWLLYIRSILVHMYLYTLHHISIQIKLLSLNREHFLSRK